MNVDGKNRKCDGMDAGIEAQAAVLLSGAEKPVVGKDFCVLNGAV
jgi:hypothetical protein